MSFLNNLIKFGGVRLGGDRKSISHPETAFPSLIPKGFCHCYASSHQVIPSGVLTTLEFDDVREDTLGIYNPATKGFLIPVGCVGMDWEIRIEQASNASGFGSLAGVRVLQLPGYDGMGAIIGEPVQTGVSAGIANLRGSGRMADVSVDAGSEFLIRFSQNSGADIRVGASNGTGAGQCYVKLWIY